MPIGAPTGLGAEITLRNPPVQITGTTVHLPLSGIVMLIFASLWLGALGWEILWTLSFDYRLLRETKWKSVLSAVHSLAYYLSRYATLAFCVLFVRQSALDFDDRCHTTLVGTTAIFAVSVCAINLVFSLRTIAIWNMRWIAIIPLAVSWLLIFAFAVALPFNTKTRAFKGFCLWETSDFWVGSLMVSVVILSLINFFLTVGKLNRQGWRSVARGLLPQTQPNLDSEDVRVMLVQRTTAFFAIQLLLIIVVVTVFFSHISVNYRLMNFVAYKAITASMAGKIFRRSWRLTRDVDAGVFNCPPSYYPGWAEGADDLPGAGGRDGIRGDETRSYSCDVYRKKPQRNGIDNDYIEGEFRSCSKSAYDVRTDAQTFAANHRDSRRMSASAIEGLGREENVLALEDIMIDNVADIGNATQLQMSSPIGLTPSVALAAPPHVLDRSSVMRKGQRTQSKRLLRPSTEPIGKPKSLRHQVMERRRPISASPGWDSVMQQDSEDDGTSEVDDQLTEASQASLTPPLTTTIREDLNVTPERSRLWLDSSAERARREAASVGLASSPSVVTFASGSLRAKTPSDAASGSYSPSIGSSSRLVPARADKRAILCQAEEAGNRLTHQARTLVRIKDSTSVAKPAADEISVSRTSFLASPAIISSDTPRLDRQQFDVDAMRQALQSPALVRPKTSGGREGTPVTHKDRESDSRKFAGIDGAAKRSDNSEKSTPSVRPKTAPSPQLADLSPVYEVEGQVVQDESIDALDAFRKMIDSDSQNRQIGGSDDDALRPRTSRGGALGSFGQSREKSPTKASDSREGLIGLGVLDDVGSPDGRPMTSHGGPNIRPFGAAQVNGHTTLSAIEAQYEKLAAYANREETDYSSDS